MAPNSLFQKAHFAQDQHTGTKASRHQVHCQGIQPTWNPEQIRPGSSTWNHPPGAPRTGSCYWYIATRGLGELVLDLVERLTQALMVAIFLQVSLIPESRL